MELSSQEYWSGLPLPPPGDFPDPGIEPTSPVAQGVSGPSSSCVWNPRVFADDARVPAMQEMKMWVQSLGQEDPLEEGMATHSSILGWIIPWTEEPGGL